MPLTTAIRPNNLSRHLVVARRITLSAVEGARRRPPLDNRTLPEYSSSEKYCLVGPSIRLQERPRAHEGPLLGSKAG
jgi:hypothetical protein